MSYIVVCPLEDISPVAAQHGATEMVSLLGPGQPLQRPNEIDENRHLIVGVNDIQFETEGLTSPDDAHVASIIEFARTWDQTNPLLIHCWFGVSRSPAAALISALSVRPERDDSEIAQSLRNAAPSATPNARIIEIGDRLLKRDGKLIRAVREIGRGAETSQGSPFKLPLA